MFLPCRLIKFVKAVVDYFSFSSPISFSPNHYIFHHERKHAVRVLQLFGSKPHVLNPACGLTGIWSSPGPPQAGYKKGHNLQHLAKAGGEQMAPDDTWAVCRRCWDTWITQEPGASLQSCLIYSLPRCLPTLHTRRGKWGQEKSLMLPRTLPALICMASAFPIAQADFSLVFPSFPESSLCTLSYKHKYFV